MKHLEKKSLLMFLAFSAFSASCARKRAVEKMVDVDDNRYAKSSFADGRPWLGRVMIINNGSNSAFGFVGAQSEVRLGTFQFTKDRLQYVADNGMVKTGEKKIINEWEITHSEYHRKVTGGKVSNTETENEQKAWDEKKYFKVKWETATISEAMSFPYEIDEECWTKKASRVVPDSMEVDADHINFVVEVDYQVTNMSRRCISDRGQKHEEYSHTMQYMYSFMPDSVTDYKPYVYTGENDPLIKKYGYFLSTSPYLNKHGTTENSFLMNRWATGKTHTFYLAEGFPEQYKWVYTDPVKGVIARTNKLFADHKIDLKFEVKEADADHKFGDIRYSFFNWISADDANAPLGYGPSTAHPLTGEIISANSTMWTASLQYYLKRMADKEVIVQDREKTSALYKKINQILGTSSDKWTATSSFLNDKDQAAVFRYLLPDFTYGNQGNQFANLEKTVQQNESKSKLEKYWEEIGQSDGEYKLASEHASQARKDYFKSEMNNLKKIQSRSQVWYLNESMFNNLDKVIQGSTEQEILDDILYRTAIHEFGHNLNLRHNFYGSVDAASRKSTTKSGIKNNSTSVMDYLDLESEIGLEHDWEDYDRAALLYAYSNGKIDKINESGDPYLFCTDEHTISNPLCNRFDTGATATEIVSNMIASYEDGYWMRNFRYGREFWQPNGYAGEIFSTMYKMKKFIAFSDQAFKSADILRNLTVRTDLDPKLPEAFAKGINADMQEAVKLVAAFYVAVMQQNDNERPYQDTYDSVSGALSRQGIVYDKIFARNLLLDEDGALINPNNGYLVTSFFNLLQKPEMGGFISNVLTTAFKDPGRMFLGFDNQTRDMFIATAAGMQNRSFAPTELAKIRCVRDNTLLRELNIDLKKNPISNGDMITVPLPAETPQNASGYFKGNNNVHVILIDDFYYAAGDLTNSLGSELVKSQDQEAVLRAHRAYTRFTNTGISECF